jgi:hypothetical protein
MVKHELLIVEALDPLGLIAAQMAFAAFGAHYLACAGYMKAALCALMGF